MENSKSKIGFFKRIKIAIFKLEEYGMFLGERITKALKYFLLLVLLITVVTVIASTYKFRDMLIIGVNYITNELPEFSYEDNVLKFEKNVDAYDEKYDFKLYINTDDNLSNDILRDYENNIYSFQNGLIFLKDRVIFSSQSFSNLPLEISFSELSELYNVNVSIANKQELINIINSFDINDYTFAYSTTSFITMYIENIITIFMDLILIALFGYVASRLCGIRFKFSPILALSIYAITLSVVLSGIYNVVYILSGFYIKYFNIMYLLIAYIYIIAAIFMIKYDLIKQSEELQKVLEVQRQVREEAEEQEAQENKDKDKENKEKEKEKEDPPVEIPEEENKEPDGSEI